MSTIHTHATNMRTGCDLHTHSLMVLIIALRLERAVMVIRKSYERLYLLAIFQLLQDSSPS